MTATGMELVIPAPALLPRTAATITTTAYSLDSALPNDPEQRWRAGAKFQSLGCRGPVTRADSWCNNANIIVDSTSDSALETFSSFEIDADEKCSTIAVDESWLVDRATIRMTAMESAQIASELLTGAATGNPSLRSSATASTQSPLSPASAAAVIEDMLGESLHGAQGFVSMSPGVFTRLQAGGGLIQKDGFWETATGHRIIAEPAFDTNVGPTTDVAGDAWIYGSAPIYWKASEPRVLASGDGALQPFVNERTIHVVRDVLVLFDPCATVAAGVTLYA